MKPLIVSQADPMVKIRVIVVKDHVEKALKALHEIGTLHVEKSEELSQIDRAVIEQGRKLSQELLTFTNDMLSYIPPEEVQNEVLDDDITVIYTRPFSELEKEVNELYNNFSDLHKKTLSLSEEIKKLTDIKKYIGALSNIANVNLRDLNFSGRHLSSRTFAISNETYESLASRLTQYVLTDASTHIDDNETVLYIVAHTEHIKEIESLVIESGGKVINIPDEDVSMAEFLSVTDKRIQSLEAEDSKLRGILHDKVKENLKKLVLIRGSLIAEHERFTVLERATEAKYVTLIEGWLPENSTDIAIEGMKEVADYIYVDTRKPDKAEEPPTKQTNLKSVRPFQVIVGLFGTPGYREWDPTPIVAYSFALFYSLMFADVIYGICLLLVAKFVMHKLVDNPNTDGFIMFRNLLYVCGIGGIITGALSGGYLGDIYIFFGIKSMALVPAIENVFTDAILFILLAICIGVVHINIAHVFGLIKGIKQRSIGVILNKCGLFILQIFGIPLIVRMIMGITVSWFNYDSAMIGIIVSIVLLATSTIIQSKGFGAILWLFDITGLLGDVISYARLAGVGLASYYLASCFNLLAKLFSTMIPGTGGAIIGVILMIIILVAGHSLSLFLGILGGFIHSMRLCFIEFLLKFYDGSGREYSPFKLKNKATALVAEKI